jgi:hypothetical protein
MPARQEDNVAASSQAPVLLQADGKGATRSAIGKADFLILTQG